MKAKSLLKERRFITENSFLDLVVWQLPEPVKGSKHLFKYRLAFIVDGECVLRYDNETGKGDHKHVGDQEISTEFTDMKALVDDFLQEAEQWRQQHEYSNN